MFFHVEQRRIWIRTLTHTLIHEGDPFFEEIRRAESGTIMRILRVWLASDMNDRPVLQVYLGSVRCCAMGPDRSELRRLLRRAGACTAPADQSAGVLRHQLKQCLRERLNQ